MTQPPKIPAPQTRKEVERLRESNRQQVTLALDELIAMVEAGLRRQRRERLEGKYRVERKEA